MRQMGAFAIDFSVGCSYIETVFLAPLNLDYYEPPKSTGAENETRLMEEISIMASTLTGKCNPGPSFYIDVLH